MTSRLQTVERTLQLLDTFVERPAHLWSLTELSKNLGASKATVLRMLSTLEQHAYVVRIGDPPRYRLGPSAFALGGAALQSQIRQVAHPELDKLTWETGETSTLHIISGTEHICLDKVESLEPVRVTYDIGRAGPLHTGGSGKALLAFLTHDQLDRLLPNLELRRYTDQTITDLDELRRELARVRDCGYAFSCGGELDPGVSSVGAPVWNSVGELEASVTLVGPAERWTEERWSLYIQKVLEATNRISRKLGYQQTNHTHASTNRRTNAAEKVS